MSLIKCLECGKEISDKSEKCIHCGLKIRKCAECGKVLDSSGLCKYCGFQNASEAAVNKKEPKPKNSINRNIKTVDPPPPTQNNVNITYSQKSYKEIVMQKEILIINILFTIAGVFMVFALDINLLKQPIDEWINLGIEIAQASSSYKGYYLLYIVKVVPLCGLIAIVLTWLNKQKYAWNALEIGQSLIGIGILIIIWPVDDQTWSGALKTAWNGLEGSLALFIIYFIALEIYWRGFSEHFMRKQNNLGKSKQSKHKGGSDSNNFVPKVKNGTFYRKKLVLSFIIISLGMLIRLIPFVTEVDLFEVTRNNKTLKVSTKRAKIYYKGNKNFLKNNVENITSKKLMISYGIVFFLFLFSVFLFAKALYPNHVLDFTRYRKFTNFLIFAGIILIVLGTMELVQISAMMEKITKYAESQISFSVFIFDFIAPILLIGGSLIRIPEPDIEEII